MSDVCQDCGVVGCICKPSWQIKRLKAQLAERTRERDLLADAVTQYRSQRDEARATAGELVQQLADKTAELVRNYLALGEARAELEKMQAAWTGSCADNADLREALRGVLSGFADCNDIGPPCGSCVWCSARAVLEPSEPQATT